MTCATRLSLKQESSHYSLCIVKYLQHNSEDIFSSHLCSKKLRIAVSHFDYLQNIDGGLKKMEVLN